MFKVHKLFFVSYSICIEYFITDCRDICNQYLSTLAFLVCTGCSIMIDQKFELHTWARMQQSSYERCIFLMMFGHFGHHTNQWVSTPKQLTLEVSLLNVPGGPSMSRLSRSNYHSFEIIYKIGETSICWGFLHILTKERVCHSDNQDYFHTNYRHRMQSNNQRKFNCFPK